MPPQIGPVLQKLPLVGRDAEMRVLASSLDDPECGGVSLVGPAGVGKTRLAEELRELAEARRMPTIAVRASRSASGIPLAALVPLFAHVGVLPEGATAAVQLLSHLAGEPGPEGRMVLLVDDAQDLDEVSAAVLDHLVGWRSLFLGITLRLGAGAPEPVADLWKDGHIVRVPVGPLPEEDARALVRAALGGMVDGGTMQQIVAAGAGNSLLLRELVAGALEAGVLTRRGGLWALAGSLAASPRLQDLIGLRLRGLAGDEREALELVALSEPIELSLLSGLVPLEVAERLEARGLVEATAGGGPGAGSGGLEVRLAHPLYGEMVRASLTPMRLARLCRQLAAATEGEAAGRELHPQELLRVALWRLDGGQGRAELSLAAARLAFLSQDYRLAARLARHAWTSARKLEAAMLLSECLQDSGQLAEALEVYHEAAGLAATDDERAQLATGMGALTLVVADDAAGTERILRAAGEAVVRPEAKRLVASQLAQLYLFTGDVLRCIEVSREVLEGPQDMAYAFAARNMGVALALAGRSGEGLKLVEVADTARRGEGVEERARAAVFHAARAVALREAGRFEEARVSAEAAYATAVDRRSRGAQAWMAVVLGLILVDQGQLREADRYYREAATLFGEFGHPGRRWGFGGIALVAGQAGDRAGAAAAVRELDELGPSTVRQMDVHIERGRAWAAMAAGELRAASELLWAAVELAEGWGQLASAAAALHDLVRIGADVPAACERLVALADAVDGELMRARVLHARAAAGGAAPPGFSATWASGGSRAAGSAGLASAARAEGQAAELAGDAADGFEACGAYLLAAEAAVLSERLFGEQRLLRRASAAAGGAQRLLARLDGAATPGLSRQEAAEPLSAREREVALLAAGGLTSKEIAEKLYLSSRTVENHLQRVYVKLGVTGRGELAAQLAGG